MSGYENFRNALRARNQFASNTGMGRNAAGGPAFTGMQYASPGESQAMSGHAAKLESDAANAAQEVRQENALHQRAIDEAQIAHERNLQAAEQQRRQYDSETQRRKFGMLGGLISGMSPLR